MDKFTVLEGVAAPMPLINIDTDMLVPKQYLKTIQRTGLGKILFDEMRHDAQGRPIPDFILNRAPYNNAKILVTGANFGCGSSREHAPWALLDFGIRAILAPSFADIFSIIALKTAFYLSNYRSRPSILLMADAKSEHPVLTIDLENLIIRRPNGSQVAFDVDPASRKALLEGLDEIGLSLRHAGAVDRFEELQYRAQPWLYARGAGA